MILDIRPLCNKFSYVKDQNWQKVYIRLLYNIAKHKFVRIIIIFPKVVLYIFCL